MMIGNKQSANTYFLQFNAFANCMVLDKFGTKSSLCSGKAATPNVVPVLEPVKRYCIQIKKKECKYK